MARGVQHHSCFVGGIGTGVYTTNTPEAVLYQLKHSRANIAVVDSEIQLQKLLPLVCLVIRVEDRLVKGGCCACSVLPLIV